MQVLKFQNTMSHSTNLLLSLFLLLQLYDTFYMISASDIPKEVSSDGSPLNVDHKKNYCLRNITYYEEIAVNKTRQVEVMPTGVLKMFKKSKLQTEYYVDLEKVPRTRLVNECCEGYAMADNKTCQPVCPSGCPVNGFCRAPQMCQCRRGYFAVKSAFMMDTYYCDPRCTSGCPHGGHCVAPELCECAKGYQASDGTCIPTCASGDGVDCVDTVTSSTEATIYESTESNSNEVDTTERYAGVTGSGSDSGNGEEGGDADDDGDDDDDDDDNDDDSNLPFPSKEENSNCTLQPCIGNTNCKLVGRCACADGFIRHQPAPINGIEVGPICAAVIEQGEPLHDESTSNSWIVAFFTIVGVVVMMSALAVLMLKLWRHQRGSLDVEGKNDMCCKYDKNNSSVNSGHVDMI